MTSIGSLAVVDQALPQLTIKTTNNNNNSSNQTLKPRLSNLALSKNRTLTVSLTKNYPLCHKLKIKILPKTTIPLLIKLKIKPQMSRQPN